MSNNRELFELILFVSLKQFDLFFSFLNTKTFVPHSFPFLNGNKNKSSREKYSKVAGSKPTTSRTSDIRHGLIVYHINYRPKSAP